MTAPPAIALALGPALGTTALRLLAATCRLRLAEGRAGERWRAGTPFIFATWHSRVLLLPALYRGRRLRVLISRSRDGELVARLCARFGLEVARGSSSRGGAEALRTLARALAEGTSVVVVPDGPRGPREVVKPGIVALAALSGAAIVPVALGASSAWRLDSWDGFRIPRPFARCVVRFGEPIAVSRAADPDAREAARKEIETALHAVSDAADLEAAA
jgi:lysophospholipid acyltransferase (LPLAT)-like uncharacterized protein